MKCEYCEELKKNQSLLFETKYWKIFLNKDQAYLGRSRIISKRHVDSLASLNEKEWMDLHIIIQILEGSLKKTFGAKMFNWTSMMNDAYLTKKPDPHVHLHFRPRYDKKINLSGIVFEDIEFGKHYDRARRQYVTEEIVRQIIKRIKGKI